MADFDAEPDPQFRSGCPGFTDEAGGGGSTCSLDGVDMSCATVIQAIQAGSTNATLLGGGGNGIFQIALPGGSVQSDAGTTIFGQEIVALNLGANSGGLSWLDTFSRTFVSGVLYGSKEPGESLRACIARNADQTTFGVSSKITNGAFAALTAASAALGLFSQIPTQSPWANSATTITNVVARSTGQSAAPAFLSAAGAIGGYLARSLGASRLGTRIAVKAAAGASEGAMVGATVLTGASIGLAVGSFINCNGGLANSF